MVEIKKCGCCGASYDMASWETLQSLGTQDDGVEVLELRLCTCRSTNAIVVGPSEHPGRPDEHAWDERIDTLRSEAGRAGDMAQVALCDRALSGDKVAYAACVRVIRDAEAQS